MASDRSGSADIDRVDRCTTCHLGVDDPAFGQAAQPSGPTVGRGSNFHQPERFGCTVCHSGQGEATGFQSAAHRPVAQLPEPMRSSELMEADCGACHRERVPRQSALARRRPALHRGGELRRPATTSPASGRKRSGLRGSRASGTRHDPTGSPVGSKTPSSTSLARGCRTSVCRPTRSRT